MGLPFPVYICSTRIVSKVLLRITIKMVQRVTYRRRLSYNTKSNRRKIVRTPGGKLVFQYLKKRPNVPKCPMTGIRLKGVKPMRPSEKSRHSLRQKSLPCLWRCFEPQSCKRKDCSRLPYRRTENRHE